MDNWHLTGCVAFEPATQSRLEQFDERPFVAMLCFGVDPEITKLSTVKALEERLLHTSTRKST